jgi:hypothetical protein
MTANIHKLFTSYQDLGTEGNQIAGDTFVGQRGRLWYDPVTNTFRASDGNTPGGIIVGGSSGNSEVYGSNTWVQYNNSGNFGGSSNFTFDSSTNVLSATYFSGDGGNLSNVNLTGAAAGNTTEIQFNTSGNFNASGNLRFDTGSNTLYTDEVAIPTGTLLSGSGEIVYVIATLTLNQILANSDGSNTALPANSYGNPNEVPAPWAVFQFTTTPSPALEINDVLSGAGVPVPSNIVYIGTGGNSNVVVTSSTFFGLPTPIPTFGTPIPVARATLNAGLSITTDANTDIVMTPGAGGSIIFAGNLIPLTNDEFTLGSPTRRIKQSYFGSNTIFIFDEYLGIDQSIGANNGNLIINGGTGLTVGEFILSGNTLYLDNPAADFNIGTIGATGNLTVNRRFNVNNSTGQWKLFDINPNGTATLISNVVTGSNIAAIEIIGATTRDIQSPNNAGVLLHTSGTSQAPSRIYNDSYGNDANGRYSAYIGRRARGNALAPTGTLNNDIISRIGANPADSSNSFAAISTTRIDFVNSENQTPTAKGGRIEIWNTPVGSNVIALSTRFDTNGVALVGNTTTTGIKFADNTFQNTAFNDTSAVTSVTVGVGLTQTATVGDVGIDATGVTTVAGTANQVFVNGNTSGGNSNSAVTLTLPQNIGINSSPTFGNMTITGNLTVSNLISTGNSIVDSKTLNLAANSTSNSQIDQGGIILGNANAAYAVSILYNLANDEWDTNGTGLRTLDLVADNANIDFLYVQNGGHFGVINESLDYPNAYVQVDSNVNSYSQIISQNHSPGTAASADLVLVNDIGDDGNHYIDMGINGSNYTDPAFSSTLANDGYLFVNQGNLVIGTDTAAKTIKFVAGGTTSSDIILTISNTGLTTPGNVTANYFIGNGSQLTGIVAGNITGQVANALVAGTVYTAAQPNITSVGTLTSLSVSGNITSGNANLGNVATANYFVGNGYGLTSINVSNIIGTIANANYAAYAGNVTIAAQPNITSVGTLTALTVSGNANVGNLGTGRVIATGNISGTQLISNIATGTAPLIVTSTTAVANLRAATANTANTVTTAAQPNITSVGNLANLTSNGTVNFANAANVNIGAVANLHIAGGTANFVLQTDGAGTLSWVANPGVGAITTITPNALSSSVHVAAVTTGNTANIITDATTANTANTLVLRDANGAISVNGWTVGTHLTAVNYTATNSDYWIGTTTKNKTITLPNAANGASVGRQYQIADTVHSGNPGTTIAAQSPATVTGNQPSQQGQIIIATYVGTTWYLN